jgi:hypothetical protein
LQLAAAGSGKGRPCVRDHEKGASPSPRSKRPEELEMKTKKTTHDSMRTGAADAARDLLSGGKGCKKKKGPGGRRNALKRLNSAKEIKVNSFDFLWPGFAG